MKAFLKEQMCIEAEIAINDAFRVGQGKNRPMVVKLANISDRGTIFKHGKNLKGKTNKFEKSFRVKDQKPGRIQSNIQRRRQLLEENEAKGPEDKLKMEMDKGRLLINDQEYVKEVKWPKVRNTVLANIETIKILDKQKITKGNPVHVETSTFTGYTAPVRTIQEVNVVYAEICKLEAKSRHIICAFRIPGKRFHVYQDYNDCDEHGCGRLLLDLLVQSEIQKPSNLRSERI